MISDRGLSLFLDHGLEILSCSGWKDPNSFEGIEAISGAGESIFSGEA